MVDWAREAHCIANYLRFIGMNLSAACKMQQPYWIHPTRSSRMRRWDAKQQGILAH